MKDLTTAAKKLDKVFEIAHIVFGALAIAALAGIILNAILPGKDYDFEG